MNKHTLLTLLVAAVGVLTLAYALYGHCCQ